MLNEVLSNYGLNSITIFLSLLNCIDTVDARYVGGVVASVRESDVGQKVVWVK